VGVSALAANTSGANNTAIGNQAGLSNLAGSQNTAIGRVSLYTNTTGNNNTSLGYESLNRNTTGSDNVAVGYDTMYFNTTGGSNVGIGREALLNNTTASNNTAVGYQAGYTGTTANNSSYFGYQAGYSLTTGAGNCLIGNQAGRSLTTGGKNTFVGSTDNSTNFSSGYYVTTGSSNTIVGNYSGNQGGLDIRTASNYIVLSDGNGNPRGFFDGSGNLFVDCVATPDGTTRRGFEVIANTGVNDTTKILLATTTTSTRALIEFNNGNGNVGSINTSGSATNYVTSSDYRLKNTITPMTGALAKVALLKPCTYKWNADGSDGEGFIAHELAEVCPDAVVGIKDAVDENGNPIHQGIDTSFLVATLTAAIQELKAEFDAYKLTHP
jgi:hypothetical protein